MVNVGREKVGTNRIAQYFTSDCEARGMLCCVIDPVYIVLICCVRKSHKRMLLMREMRGGVVANFKGEGLTAMVGSVLAHTY